MYCDGCRKQKPNKQLIRTLFSDGVSVICKSCGEKYEKEHPKTQDALKREYFTKKLQKNIELQEMRMPFGVSVMHMSDEFLTEFKCSICRKLKPIDELEGMIGGCFSPLRIWYCIDCKPKG